MTFVRTSTDTIKLDRYASWFIPSRTSGPQGTNVVKSEGVRYPMRYSAGDKVPEYRTKIRRHINASGGYSLERTRYTGGFGTDYASLWRRWYLSGNSGPLGPVLHWESVTGRLVDVSIPGQHADPGNADSEAAGRLIKQALRQFTAFKSLTAMGELRETLRMIRRPARSLFKKIGDYVKITRKRGIVIKNPAKRRSFLRDSYLEATFGWQPLVNDIASARNALEKNFDRFSRSYARVSGSASNTVSTEDVGEYRRFDILLARYYYTQTLSSYSKRFYGEVKCTTPNPFVSDRRLFGVTLADIALTGWELVPYSFVIDYFTNIGDILESWVLKDSDWAWLSSVTLKRTRIKTTRHFLQNYYITSWPQRITYMPWVRSASFTPAVAVRFSMDRATPLGPPTESFRWELPGVGSRKWLNIAALSKVFSDTDVMMRR